MNKQLSTAAAAMVLTAAGTLSTPASASLVLESAVQLQGQGLGAVTTALTLQSPANTTNETGGVNLGGPFGNALTGASQSQLFTLGGRRLSNANQLGLIVNINEPGNENPPSVILNNLTLTAFSASSVSTDLDPELGQEIHDVFCAAINLGVALLAPVTLHLGHGHSVDADRSQRLADFVKLEGFDNSDDELHVQAFISRGVKGRSKP